MDQQAISRISEKIWDRFLVISEQSCSIRWFGCDCSEWRCCGDF